MDARSALFDVYGDHLRERTDVFRGRAPVAALVRLLAALGIAAPAVRTAVSRMAHQGWLDPVRIDGASAYALTARASRRLEDAASRIYRTRDLDGWNGTWHLLVITPPTARAARERLAAGLSFLGYGVIADSARASTWIAARASDEVDAILVAEGARAERFTAHHDGDSQALVSRAWDLEAVARAYHRFLDRGTALVAQGPPADDEAAFARRTLIVHEWRKFLFLDPGLPLALLPPDWPGRKAAEWFDSEESALMPAAERFVEACLH